MSYDNLPTKNKKRAKRLKLAQKAKHKRRRDFNTQEYRKMKKRLEEDDAYEKMGEEAEDPKEIQTP